MTSPYQPPPGLAERVAAETLRLGNRSAWSRMLVLLRETGAPNRSANKMREDAWRKRPAMLDAKRAAPRTAERICIDDE